MIHLFKDTMDTDITERCLDEISGKASASDLAEVAPSVEFFLLAKAGYLKIVLPGEPLDFNLGNTVALLHILKAVGKANLSVGRIYEGHINALYLIHLYAKDDQKEYWYNEVKTKDALFGVWNTQASEGVKFTIERNKLTVKGKKTFCSGAALATHGLITGEMNVKTRKGWQMMIVEMSRIKENKIDTSSWKTLGMRASGSFTVDFTGYTSNGNELVGEPDEYLKQPYFNGGAIRFAAVQLGGIEAIAQETLAYLQLLDRTTDTLQNTRVSNIMVSVNSGKLWIKRAGENFDQWAHRAEKSSDLIAFANMTRTAIEEIGISVMRESNQCVGARGLMHPFAFERLYRDLSFYLRQPYPDTTKLDIATYYFKRHKEGYHV